MARHTSGWIKLHRKLDQSWISDDIYSIGLWSLLLIWANRSDGVTQVKGSGGATPVKRGQVVTSAVELSKKLKCPRRTLERRLKTLENDHVIVQEVSSHGRIITICKFDDYQSNEDDVSPTTDQQNVQQGAQQDAQPRAHIVEKRRNKEVKNNPIRQTTWESAHPLSRVFENLRAFPKYWSIFDLKKDERTIRDHMDHHGLSIAQMEDVTRALRCWADGPQAEKIKSPRGVLSTFVGRYAQQAKSMPKQKELLTVTENDLEKLY